MTDGGTCWGCCRADRDVVRRCAGARARRVAVRAAGAGRRRLVAGPPRCYGDVVAEPDGLGRVLRDDRARVLALRVAAGARARLAEAVDRARARLDAAPAAGRRRRRRQPTCACAGREMTRAGVPGPAGAAPRTRRRARWPSVDAVDEPALRLRRRLALGRRVPVHLPGAAAVAPADPAGGRRRAGAGPVTAVALVLGLLAALAYAGGSTGLAGARLGAAARVAGRGLRGRRGRPLHPHHLGPRRRGWTSAPTGSRSTRCTARWRSGSPAPAAPSGCWRWRAWALLVTRHFVDFGFAARRGWRGRAGRRRGRGRRLVRAHRRATGGPVRQARGDRPGGGADHPAGRARADGRGALGVRGAARARRRRGAAGRRPGGSAGRWPAGSARPRRARAQLAVQVDGRPLPLHGWRVGGPLGWLLPAFSRAARAGRRHRCWSTGWRPRRCPACSPGWPWSRSASTT